MKLDYFTTDCSIPRLPLCHHHTSHPKPAMISLESLLLDLSLSSSDGSSRVGVNKAAALLAVLELCALGGADANTAGVDLGAARAAAVRVGDAAACGELLGLAVADILGTGVVGSQSEDRDGDC